MTSEPRFPEKAYMDDQGTELCAVGPHTQLQPQIQLDAEAQRRDNDSQHLPYPRWATLLTRGTASIMQSGALAYTAWYLAKWSSDDTFRAHRHGYEKALASVSPFNLLSIPDVIVLGGRVGERLHSALSPWSSTSAPSYLAS